MIMNLFNEINKEGKTIIIVTHDLDLVKRTSEHKIYKIVDGEIN